MYGFFVFSYSVQNAEIEAMVAIVSWAFHSSIKMVNLALIFNKLRGIFEHYETTGIKIS